MNLAFESLVLSPLATLYLWEVASTRRAQVGPYTAIIKKEEDIHGTYVIIQIDRKNS